METKKIGNNEEGQTYFGAEQIAFAKAHLKMLPNETLLNIRRKLIYVSIGLFIVYAFPIFMGRFKWETTFMFGLVAFLIIRRWIYFQQCTQFAKVLLQNNQATIASYLIQYFRKKQMRLQHNAYDPYTFHLIAQSKHNQYEIVTFICIDDAVLMNHHFTSYSVVLPNNNAPYRKLKRDIGDYLQLQNSSV